MKKHELEYESDSRNVRELYAPGKFIITQLRKAEEVLIISVLKEFLGRNPDINDFKKNTKSLFL